MAGVTGAARAILAALVAWGTGGIAFEALAQDARSVLVGGDGDADACGSLYRVNIRELPGNFLAVRAAPTLGAAILDRLEAGTAVFACEQEGDWLGVVYGSGVEECGVAQPIPTRGPYSGPCRSGWVYSRYLGGQAG